MKLGAFNLLVLLSVLLGIAACGEKPGPTMTMDATEHKQTESPSDSTITERISRLMEFYERKEWAVQPDYPGRPRWEHYIRGGLKWNM